MTSCKSGTPLISGRSANLRSFRNPFEPVGSRLSSSHPSRGHKTVFETPPFLVSRDQRDKIRAANMNADLHQIAALESGRLGVNGGRSSPFGLLLTEGSGYLSWEARSRRQAYYYAMCALCVFPFMAPLAYRGVFDSALSWYTRGEVASLTRQQRRNVLVLGIVLSGVWLVLLTVFVTVLVNRAQE